MCKLVIISGQSGAGKNFLLTKLLNFNIIDEEGKSITTRPMRKREQEGVEYYFKTLEEFKQLDKEGFFVEQRVYHTVNGDWYYGLGKNCIDFNSDKTYCVIVDYNGYIRLKNYIDNNYSDKCKYISIFLDCPLQERLRRSIIREGEMTDEQCLEVCRRMISDNKEIGIYKNKYDHVLISDEEHEEYNLNYIKKLLED